MAKASATSRCILLRYDAELRGSRTRDDLRFLASKWVSFVAPPHTNVPAVRPLVPPPPRDRSTSTLSRYPERSPFLLLPSGAARSLHKHAIPLPGAKSLLAAALGRRQRLSGRRDSRRVFPLGRWRWLRRAEKNVPAAACHDRHRSPSSEGALTGRAVLVKEPAADQAAERRRWSERLPNEWQRKTAKDRHRFSE